jgi:hemoglobin-like flavoprotein
MTPQQVDLIRSSFAKVLHQRDAAGRLFYDRLFTIAPEVRSLFPDDINPQARKLMDTLAVAVNALRDAPTLTATLQDLGHRHRTYGVNPNHYAKVGEALLWTLEKGLGPSFDEPTREAWTALYGVVAATMEPRASLH